MSKKVKNKKVKATEATPKEYKSPAERWWGKVLVWGVVIGMVGGVVGSVIWILIDYYTNR